MKCVNDLLVKEVLNRLISGHGACENEIQKNGTCAKPHLKIMQVRAIEAFSSYDKMMHTNIEKTVYKSIVWSLSVIKITQ